MTELTAYRRWVPALGGRAPQLRAHDDARHAIILSAVPGRPAPWPAADPHSLGKTQHAAETTLQHRAGALLARLHHAQPPKHWDEFGAAKMAEFERLTPRAATLLTSTELDFARAEIQALADLRSPERVPNHHDYNLRNWLVDHDAVYVIDFEWSHLDVWVNDLVRLSLGAWQTRPDLQEAFLDGYGRDLADDGRAALRGCSILTAVWLVVKARESGQASFEQGNRAALQRFMTDRT